MPPACAPAHADALLRVRAVVLATTTVQVAQPASVVLTDDDIARGYVEVATPVQVQVRSNVPEGYALLFERSSDAVGDVHVTGMEAPVVLSGAAAIGSRAAAGRGLWTDRLLLHFRFQLARSAQPGTHAWPVQISLLPS